jgi:hypothetical protein
MTKFPLVVLLIAGTLLSGYAASPEVPALFIPGFAASRPKEGTVLDFTFRRGAPPSTMELSVSYRALVRSFRNAGYVEGKTFFGAVFDWRMLAAPVDNVFDGTLSEVTAESITKGTYAYAVNYLGYWLDQAVQANPDCKYVDVVTHSTGGILARAYIQSPAYGAEYVDSKGVARRLPKIRHLILGACPNEGTVHTWRPWSGDFQDVLSGFIPTTEIETRFAALAYESVLEGNTITGPDHDIALDSILETDKFGNQAPDETTFFRLYTPMRQPLMPTSDFLVPAGSREAENVNDDDALRSDVLLDLNALSRPGHNPWVSRVGGRFGRGGVIATYATGARERTTWKDLVVPGLINQNPYIATLIRIDELPEGEGEYLPLLEFLKPSPATIPVTDSLFERTGTSEHTEILSGDGNAPFTSYRSTLGGDPKVELVQWGNGPVPSGLPKPVRWNRRTDWPVYHVALFYNPDVRAFVIRTLTGRRFGQEPVLTPSELKDFLAFLKGDEI